MSVKVDIPTHCTPSPPIWQNVAVLPASRRRIVRAARAEERLAGERFALRRLRERDHALRARTRMGCAGSDERHIDFDVPEKPLQCVRELLGCELHRGGQQRLALAERLAVHGRPLVGPHVEECFLDLPLHERALFLYDEKRLHAARKCLEPFRFERPDHADLIKPDTELWAHRHDAHARLRGAQQRAVERIRPHEGERGGQALFEHAALQFGALRRPAQLRVVVEAALRRHGDVRGQTQRHAAAHAHRAAAFHRLRNRLETDPQSAETRQRIAGEPVLDVFLYRRRKENRHHRAFEDVVRLVRKHRRLRRVVVAGHRQHAAVPRGAEHVGIAEHVAGAVHARPLAVPHRVHAFHTFAGKRVELLRAPQHGRAEVFVQARLEAHVEVREQCLLAPQFLIESAEWRATIAGDETRGFQPGKAVRARLFDQDAHERLGAGEKDRAVLAQVAVFESIVRIDLAIGLDGSHVHGVSAVRLVGISGF
ncbi:hypothetical protein [Paraburkholderia sp. BR10879]|uniref:hypothetical protein n=1 Tax=Paraburkholderia sp. BR10879 TaxID=3236990 RepID=UPI00397E88ED